MSKGKNGELQQDSEPIRVRDLQKTMDEESGYTQADLEREKFLNDFNSVPDVDALSALEKIFGDKTVVDEKSGEEFSFPEEDYLEQYEYEYHNAILSNEKTKDEIEDLKNAYEKAKTDLKWRADIRNAFFHEIGEVRANKPGGSHLLVITQDDRSKPIQSIRLSKISVANWALKHAKLEIPEWGAVRFESSGTHTTELLQVLKAVIDEFWENKEPNTPAPNRLAVIKWMEERFPDLKESGILSGKMTGSIYTICRPRDIKK